MSKLNKRIMSAVLTFILFMTNIPVVGSADNSTFAITYEGETVKKVEFYNHEKITVTAENIPEGSHQWQIKIPGTEQWVNIHGQTDAEIGLSYAVVGSLLVDDSAYVRCAAISEGLEIAHTATLRVTVKEEPVYVAPVVEATKAPIEETEAPIEETEAPVEETEAPIEETEAPVEETEAPVEETEAPVEETEAPVEETEAPVEETEAPVETTETPAEPVAEVPAAPAEEEPAAPVAETEAVIEEPAAPVAETEAVIEEAAAPVAETEAVTEETEEATEATAEPTEAPKKTTKKSSKKTSTKSVTNQKTESVTPKAAGTDDIELVSVTINYVYWDRHHKQAGNQAWDPTVANIVKGSNYSNTVVNKIIPGYKTTFVIYDEDGTTKLADGNPGGAQLIDGNYKGDGEPPAYDPDVHTSSAVKIDLASVDKDIVYTVYYQEIEVPYTARYFLQNVYNDLYSENTDLPTTEQQAIMKGYQNTEPDPNEIYVEIPGFTALFHQPDKIAADGSTVFEVYYDRNYYLINFDMDGGYGTAPVYARFETAFSVSNPTKAGYTFPAEDGWELIDWTKKTDGTPEENAAYNADLADYIAAAETNTNGVIKEVPYTNMTYKAQWTTQKVNYTVAYWILDEDGNKTFIGSSIREKDAGKKVDGDGDLTSSMPICGNEDHVHGDNCMSCKHMHTNDCYNGLSMNNPSAQDQRAFANIGEGEPESGYAYVITATGDGNSYYYLPYENHWYYKFNDASCISGTLIAEGTYTEGTKTWTARKYYANLPCGHAHSDACTLACDANLHQHSDSCYQDTTYLDYVANKTFTDDEGNEFTIKTDKQVEVKGDGSTVVNVYYKYKEYTLKFYYAFSKKTGSANPTYHVIGGSSHPFGWDDTDVLTALKKYTTGGYQSECGEVDELPKLTPAGIEKYSAFSNQGTSFDPVSYEEDGKTYSYNAYYDSYTESNTTYKLYYISFSARYGDVISHLWPCDVFKPVTRVYGNSHNWPSKEAVVSGWNGEYRVKYTREHSNPTIKGLYERLDDNLLFLNSFNDPRTEVSYVCFWENGVNKNWSVPELYIYNIWLPCLDNKPENAPKDPVTNEKKTTKSIISALDGQEHWYYLESSTRTTDDSRISSQTITSLTGYTYKETTWGAIFISQAVKSGNIYIGQGNQDITKITYNPSTHVVKELDTNWQVTQELSEIEQTDGTYLLQSSDYETKYKSDTLNETVYREAYYRDFYYTANIHKLNFWNRNDWLNSGEGVVGGVAYGASLAKYFNGVTVDGHKYDGANDIVLYPEKYPSGLEPDAYYFEGWYTTAECLEGTKVDWETMTMPDHDLTVYANWLPITHDTYFYLDYEDYANRWLEDGETLDSTKIYQSVLDTPHGESMKTDGVDLLPSNGTYRFVGWFYLDENGEKVAFNPAEMAVRKELHLYAEWTSTVSKQYTVQYFKGDDTDGTIKIVDAGGNEVAVDANTGRPVAGTNPVKLADNLNGYAFESTTKTFDAKPKDKLNLLSNLSDDDQKALWLPHTNSHSIVVQSLESDNYFAFIYVRREKAPYWVRYVDAATGQEIRPTDYNPNNEDAAVTVQFEYIHGYIPNSFYETLILSANEAENVITFYYTKDSSVDPGEGGTGSGSEDKNARYYVAHYIQTVDGKGFELYTSDEPVDEIGKTVTATPLTIPGFEFVPDSVEVGGTTYTTKKTGVVKSGKDDGDNKALILELYYTRNKYGYKVQYLQLGTTKDVKDPVTRGDDYFMGTSVKEKAPDVEGYEIYGSKEQTLKIGAEAGNNIITFYYTPQPLTVNYVAVCPDNRGADFAVLTKEKEVTNDGHNAIIGSQAIPKSGFWFKGWYADEEGHDKIQDDATLKPQIEKDYGEYTYYALFEPIKLKITQEGMRTEVGTSHLDSCIESGVYEVVKIDGGSNTVVATVIITGNNSVIIEQIPAGTYTVRELTGWTWTYGGKTASQNVTVTASSEVKEVKFGHTANEIDWLHDEATQ